LQGRGYLYRPRDDDKDTADDSSRLPRLGVGSRRPARVPIPTSNTGLIGSARVIRSPCIPVLREPGQASFSSMPKFRYAVDCCYCLLPPYSIYMSSWALGLFSKRMSSLGRGGSFGRDCPCPRRPSGRQLLAFTRHQSCCLGSPAGRPVGSRVKAANARRGVLALSHQGRTLAAESSLARSRL
jgi:hypothetical protein